MQTPETTFDCLLITRPLAEARELADLLADLTLQVVIQPAHEFEEISISDEMIEQLVLAARSDPGPLLVFTSPRSVKFALAQLPLEVVATCQLAAVGPATAAALLAGGLASAIQSDSGYTSEDLLHRLDDVSLRAGKAWIIAAAGGRTALLHGLQQRGIDTDLMLAYERRPAILAEENIRSLEQGKQVLSVWTSSDAMQRLSAGMSAGAWKQVCAGEWLLISQRLADKAAVYQPAAVYLSDGPGNAALAAAIRRICLSA